MKSASLPWMALAVVCLFAHTLWGQNTYYWNEEGKVELSQDRTAYIVQGDAQAMQQLRALAKSDAVQRSSLLDRLEVFSHKPFAIVHLKEARDLSAEAMAERLQMRSGKLDFAQPAWQLADGFQLWATARVVCRPRAGVSPDAVESILRSYRADYTVGMGEVWRIDVRDGKQALALANALYESGLMEFAQPDFYAPLSMGSDPLYPEQFQMNNTGQTIDGFAGAPDADCNAPEAWAISTGSSNIVVAVIDDGVENHEDLNDGSGNSRLIGGFTPVNNGNGLPNSSGAHGQACAGIVAASHNSLGVRGLAPQVRLLSVNIFEGGETTQDIADAITWAKNNGADVLSNSWGYTSCTASFANINNALADATNNGRSGKGCVIVFASGNGYKSCVDYPANNSNVIAVGAFGNDGIKSDYSNAGSDLDLAAPSNDISQFGFLTGAGVRTIDRMGGAGYSSGNYTNSFGGTSAACPVVAGVAALVLSVDPSLTHSQVKNTLYNTAIDMGASGFDNNYGHGRVNAFGALNSLGGGGQTPTCTDGIQNGDETGVDCGGSSCPPCQSACTDNAVTLTIVTDNYPGETTWSITDGGGNTVASGGPYGSQSTTYVEDLCLTDGCYTFTIFDSYGDGICCSWGNGSYSLVEDASGNVLASGGSFGSSEATSFCLGDTGGGGGGDPGQETVFAHFFETGWDDWQDGGSDCFRYSGSRSWEGSFSIRLRDNSGVASSMTSTNYDLSSYDAVELEFYFYPNSMENGEDFWVRYNSGSGWQTVATYASGSSFQNGSFYVATVTLDNGSVNLSNNARFRFQCDASANQDQVYIDAVTLTGITNGGTLAQTHTTPLQTIRQLSAPAPAPSSLSALESDLAIAPNPTSGLLTVQASDPMQRISVITTAGQQIRLLNNLQENMHQLDLWDLPAGMYFLRIETAEETYTEKVIVR